MKNEITDLVLVLIGFGLACLAGCSGPSRVEKAEVPASFKEAARLDTWSSYLHVYSVEVDGKTYVIATTGNGVAICPKTP